MELTILMPCLNEAETLAVCIEKAKKWIDQADIEAEILVADNGSTDGSRDIALNLRARVVEVAEKGYGAALMGGINAAYGKYVIMGDADDSYDFSSLDQFIEKLRDGYELVMGNRFRGGIKKGAMPPLHRYLGNPFLTFIGRLFIKSPSGDFHCGLRGFNKDSILDLNLHTTGMEFASEMVVKSTFHGLRICEVPTILSPDGRSRPPHLRSWRDGWRHLRFLLIYSPDWLFLIPGIIISIIGTVLSTWIMLSPIKLGSIVFDINSLIYFLLMTVIGIQLISFSVFTKVYAAQVGLMPDSQTTNWLTKTITLERGLIIAVALALLGSVLCFYALKIWGDNDFGPLYTTIPTRLIAGGVTLIAISTQVACGSFFISILNVRLIR